MKLLQQIEELKAKNLWSFRQLRRYKAPTRPKTHWDILLDEMVKQFNAYSHVSYSCLSDIVSLEMDAYRF